MFGADNSEETPKQRCDRELHELLEEIRVALPGVELLFGFLLILPFSTHFEGLHDLQRAIYLLCLLATVGATALFIAPTARHRIGFRELDKEDLLIRMNRRVIAGLFLLAISMSLGTALVVSVVFDWKWAAVIATAIVVWFASWWLLVPPFWRDRRGKSHLVTGVDGREARDFRRLPEQPVSGDRPIQEG